MERIVRSFVCVSLTVIVTYTISPVLTRSSGHTVIPPADFCLKTTSGGVVFRRIPTASSSISNILFCSAVFVASTICQLCPTPIRLDQLTHQNDQICGLCDRDDLSTSTSSFRCILYDTG